MKKKFFSLFLCVAILFSISPATAFAMQLFVKEPGGKHVTLEVEPTDRIVDIKYKLQDKLGLSTTQQQLFFIGKHLSDENTLQDYSIQKDSTLKVAVLPLAKQLTYTGAEQELIIAGVVVDSTIQYSLDQQQWSESVPIGTNAGAYTVYYKADNYPFFNPYVNVIMEKQILSDIITPLQQYTCGTETTQVLYLANYLPADCGDTTYRIKTVSGNLFVDTPAVHTTSGALLYTVRSDAEAGDSSICITAAMTNYTDVNIMVPIQLNEDMDVLPEHSCEYADEWIYDNMRHWQVCICGEKSKELQHSYGIDNTCDVCGYSRPSVDIHYDGYVTIEDSAKESVQEHHNVVIQIGTNSCIVDGNVAEGIVAPFIMNDYTMVPVRFLMEQLGFVVDWNSIARSVAIHLSEDKVLTLVIDKVIEPYGVAPVIVADYTFVPIRYVAETMGANITWIEATKEIVLEL